MLARPIAISSAASRNVPQGTDIEIVEETAAPAETGNWSGNMTRDIMLMVY